MFRKAPHRLYKNSNLEHSKTNLSVKVQRPAVPPVSTWGRHQRTRELSPENAFKLNLLLYFLSVDIFMTFEAQTSVKSPLPFLKVKTILPPTECRSPS